MPSNKKDLKAFVRYDGTGRVIPGSLILQRFKPKVGNWNEIDAYECCNTQSESVWNITDIYGPPSNGLFNIPNFCIDESLLDPNQAGQINPGASCVPAENYNQLYISLYDSNGVYSNELASMVGNSGTLTFTQGSNSVTYSFTAGSFILNANGFDVVAFDTTLSSVPGSLVVTSPATGDFNTIDPITIQVTII